jgi:hypothetical protein
MFEYFEQTIMMGIAGSQVRFEAREPIVTFFAAVPWNSRSKTVYMIFGLKFPFTKKLQQRESI